MNGCTDGTWHERRYFTCPYGRGFFCPYYNLSPDHRFDTGGNVPGAAQAVNRKEHVLSINLIPRTQMTESWVGLASFPGSPHLGMRLGLGQEGV